MARLGIAVPLDRACELDAAILRYRRACESLNPESVRDLATLADDVRQAAERFSTAIQANRT